MSKPLFRKLAIAFLSLSILAFVSQAFAAEDSEEAAEEEPKEPVMYYQIEPNIITNYQKQGRRMGFITVEVQIAVRGQANVDLIEYHEPLFENALVDILHTLDENQVKDLQHREVLRAQVKEKFAALILDEEGVAIIEDVLFTKYIYQ